MAAQCFDHPARDLHHIDFATVDPIDGERKVHLLLNGPNVFVLIGWKDRGRIAHRNPADRYCGAGWQAGLEVNDSIDTYLTAAAYLGAVKYCRAGGNEHLVLDPTADHMGIWADQAIIANG